MSIVADCNILANSPFTDPNQITMYSELITALHPNGTQIDLSLHNVFRDRKEHDYAELAKKI